MSAFPIAVTIPHFNHYADPDVIAQLAVDLEDLGVHSIWVSDHIVVPEGSGFIPPVFTEPLATLAFLASATTRVGLGTSVLIAPYRNPVFTAKNLSSVDVLSKGRLTVGVGVGWMTEEFAALGVPFDERGARTDETLDVWHNLWTTEISSFHGQFTRYDRMDFRPKAAPARSGTIPIWVGGPSTAAIERAAVRGDGWHPQNRSPEQLRAGVDTYERRCRELDRPRGTICMRHLPGARIAPEGGYRFNGNTASCAADLEEYIDAGLDMLMLSLHPPEPEQLLEQVATYLHDIVPKLTTRPDPG